MKKIAMSILVVSCMCASAGVFAADKMKPGLWSMTMKSDMMKNMPKIPPEQLEKMREMGIKMPQMQDGGITTNVCISKEMSERDHPPEMARKDTGCESKNYERSGSSYSLDLVCDRKEMKGVGRIQGTFSGNESFTSTYDFKGVSHGKPVDQHMASAGKWLSADCGNVMPIGEKKHPKE